MVPPPRLLVTLVSCNAHLAHVRLLRQVGAAAFSILPECVGQYEDSDGVPQPFEELGREEMPSSNAIWGATSLAKDLALALAITSWDVEAASATEMVSTLEDHGKPSCIGCPLSPRLPLCVGLVERTSLTTSWLGGRSAVDFNFSGPEMGPGRVRDSQGRIDDDVAGEAAGNVSVVRAREAPPSEPQEGTHKSRIKAELLKPSNAFLSLTSTNSPHLFLLVLDRTFLNTPKPSPQTCFQPAQSGNYYRKLSRFTSRESFRNSCYFNLATVDEWTYEGCVGSPNPGRIITKGQPKNVHVAKYWTHWNKPGEDSGYKVVIGWDNPNDGSTRAYQCPWYKASDHNSVIVGCSDCLKHDFTEQPPPA
ncbi:hypothetical protein PTTG_11750 [Puccinia triticina 1-1 BBBD Race 1]|uniref:Uncharacterized protein n=1 Tax=Puccinia triticina (isolate 1-1 / race 1 (BBBD)) TaxID=630390 RepID=A0A180GQU9_PUCT1|nr:hypothetical protein PTTG_11750 [Puccinia triticina 1-1 BBBD Race 1]